MATFLRRILLIVRGLTRLGNLKKIYVEVWFIAPIDQLDGESGFNGRPLSASRCVGLLDRPAHQLSIQLLLSLTRDLMLLSGVKRSFERNKCRNESGYKYVRS